MYLKSVREEPDAFKSNVYVFSVGESLLGRIYLSRRKSMINIIMRMLSGFTVSQEAPNYMC
jgi:hypothetical protein